MSELKLLAERKIESAMAKLIAGLPGEIEAMKRELNARGLRNSGATLKRTRAICMGALRTHAKYIETEYRWALSQALLASQSWSQKLIAEIPNLFAPVVQASTGHLNAVATSIGRPELAARLIQDIENERTVLESDLSLAILSAFAEKRRGLLRSLPSAVIRLLAKPFTSGA